MEEQNWDPMVHSPGEVMDFMECLESAKMMDCKSTVMTNGKDKKQPTKKNNGNNNNKGDANDNTYYCKVHGYNPTHTTEQCCKAKKLKAEGKPIGLQKCSPNKSWTHKSKEAKKKSSKELGTLVKAQVENASGKAGKAGKGGWPAKHKADTSDTGPMMMTRRSK
jgi:hypothetical protein